MVSEKPTMLPKKTIVKTTPETYDRLRSTLSSTSGVSPRAIRPRWRRPTT